MCPVRLGRVTRFLRLFRGLRGPAPGGADPRVRRLRHPPIDSAASRRRRQPAFRTSPSPPTARTTTSPGMRRAIPPCARWRPSWRSSRTSTRTGASSAPSRTTTTGCRCTPPSSSVTDAGGAPVHFEATDNGGFTELALGTDDYVHGTQSYVISYTQQNVVRAFADTGDDELYWDTNGTGFAQPFGSVTARVHVDPARGRVPHRQQRLLSGRAGLDGHAATISQAADDPAAPGGKLLTAQTSGIGAHENLTVAIGFTAGTFVQVPADYTPTNGTPGRRCPFGGSTPFGLDQTPWWSNLLALPPPRPRRTRGGVRDRPARVPRASATPRAAGSSSRSTARRRT